MSAETSGFIRAYSRRRSGGQGLPLGSLCSESGLTTEKMGEDFAKTELQNDSHSSSDPMVRGGLELDDTISGTASLWYEEGNGSILRIDPVDSVERLHESLNSGESSAGFEKGDNASDEHRGPGNAEILASLQHTFTSYAEPTGEICRTPISPDAGVKGNDLIEADQTFSDSSDGSFAAAWEVDAFEIPETVNVLFKQTGLLSSLSERLFEAVRTGLGSIMVTSLERGEGKTSVAIGLAIAGAASGIRVALVDANLTEPSLVDSLNLEVLHGWDAHSTGVPMSEIAIRSIADDLTLFPLINHGSREDVCDGVHEQFITLLSDHFDLIIFDGGTCGDLTDKTHFLNADSAVIVRDLSRSNETEISVYARKILEAGVKSVGVVENHAS